MKLKVSQLRRIIKEEVSKLVETKTVGDVVTSAGLNPHKFRDVMNEPVGRLSFSSYMGKIDSDMTLDSGKKVKLSADEYKAFSSALWSSDSDASGVAGLDVSGPEVEMVSGRSSFMIELGDDPKEAVSLFKKAAAWCSKVKGPIDYSAANSIEIGTEEDGVTIDFVTDPKTMAASFKAAADFISANASERLTVDID